MKILVLTSVYPEPDDENIVTPTVEYFCNKWCTDNMVTVIHSNSYFPSFYYFLPSRILSYFSSKFGFTFPSFASRKKIIRKEKNMIIQRLPIFKLFPHSNFTKRRLKKQLNSIISILNNDSFYPDVIISHWINPQLYLINELKKVFPRSKTSIVFHGDCTKKSIKKYNVLESLKNIDAIGCRNKTDAIKVKRLLNLNDLPFICYSGIPDQEIKNQEKFLLNNKLSNNNTFIYVGRLVSYKNVDKIIFALNNAFPQKDFKLEIFGIGAEEEKLKNLVKKLNLANNIIFNGQKNRETVMQCMRNSKYFIMISNNEVFGMVYIEAMLSGCITIASRNGGIDGVILNGKNGFLCNQGDELELANIITKIQKMSDDNLNYLRSEAMKTAKEFGESCVAKRYLTDILNYNKLID